MVSSSINTNLANDKRNAALAVAVQPADVAAALSEPQALALALMALSATAVACRTQAA